MSQPPASGPTGTLLLMAHGSRHEPANRAHLDLCEALAERVAYADVRPAFLELTGPTLPDAIAEAVTDGARVITVLPYFLHPGNHTTRDIPELVEAARAAHPGVRIEIAAAFGADDAVLDLLERQVRGATASTATP